MYKQPLTTVGLICLLAVTLTAAVPQKTSYQGLLTNNAGDPVTTQTEVIFTIWDADVGGTVLWAESLMVTPTEAGLFSLDLGEVHPITETILNGAPTYLGIKVGGDPEMTNRVELVTSPHAFHAEAADSANAIADNAISSIKILDGTITFSDIGTNGAADGQVMKMLGGNWIAANDESGSGGGWVDDGSVVRLENVGDMVGVGTTNPTEALDVLGNIHASGTIKSGSSITIDGNSDSITSNSGNLYFGDENVQTTGKIGIGSPNWTFPFSVQDADNSNAYWGAYIRNTNGNANLGLASSSGQQARVTFSTDGTGRWFLGKNSSEDFFVGTNPTSNSELYIDGATGNVGINDNSPSEMLDVDGNIHATGTIQAGNSVVIDGSTDRITAAGGRIDFDDEEILTTGGFGVGLWPTTEYPLQVYGAGATANWGARIYNTLGWANLTLASSASSGCRLAFKDGTISKWTITKDANDDFQIRQADAHDRIHISNSNGYVGLGTDSPGYALTVAGDDASNWGMKVSNVGGPTNVIFDSPFGYYSALTFASGGLGAFNIGKNGSDDLFIDDGFNNLIYIDKSSSWVGIHTSTPSAQLDVDVTDQFNKRAAEFRNDYAAGGVSAATVTIENENAAGIAMNVFANTSDAVSVMSNENSSGILFKCFGGSGYNQVFGVTANTRVGIGTHSPNYNLDVRGSIGNNVTLYPALNGEKMSSRI
jgi:hypothetical protein